VRLSSKFRRRIEHFLLLSGAVLLALVLVATLHREVMLRVEMQRFKEALSLEEKNAAPLAPNAKPLFKTLPEDRVASSVPGPPESREAHAITSKAAASRAIAILRIPKLHMELPVLNGTDAITLNRGVGRIPGTALPGQQGNIAIAGHRDGTFQGLKNVRTGDTIELLTTERTDVYVVDRIFVTDPTDVDVLATTAKPRLTLITCYPFHYIGPAPRRFVVEASLVPRK
jgi:sortase A